MQNLHLQNVTVDVMNIIVTITVVLQNASKCTILQEKIQKIFLGRVPLALEPPSPIHISGYMLVVSLVSETDKMYHN